MTRIAIAHDYLTQRGGAERVVLAMARAFPDAPIYTTFFDPESTFPEFGELDVRPARINRIAWLRRHHRAALPILPWVSSRISIDADVVLVSSSGWAHAFGTNGRRVVYCYTPARWLYQATSYLGPEAPWVKRFAVRLLRLFLVRWDRRKASAVDSYLAISRVVQGRIRDEYGRESRVLAAPVVLDQRSKPRPVPELKEWAPGGGYFLCVSRLLPYKNVDAVIEAVDQDPSRRLVIVGSGPDEMRLRGLASEQVLFLSNLSDGQLTTVYAGCKGLIAASYEDFGLSPLEAAIHGRPSVVLRWGGFLDTMIDGVTALFFDQPVARQIDEALQQFDGTHWDANAIRQHVEQFGEEMFAKELIEIVGDHAPPKAS